MHKLGLKLWSTNTKEYLYEAERLYEEGLYDYIELYTVPETMDTIKNWKAIKAPYIIHSPHFKHKMNLSKPEYFSQNMDLIKQTRLFADELNAKHIICHGGVGGDIKETAKQLSQVKDSRIILENKPYKAIPEMQADFCIGAKVEEIEYFLENTDYGFCLDIGHTIAAASTFKFDPYESLKKFIRLNPIMFHLSDTRINMEIDEHLNFGQGNMDFSKVFSVIPKNSVITIETNKASKENLDDFVEDINFLKNI